MAKKKKASNAQEYILIRGSHSRFENGDFKLYKPGDSITLTPLQRQRLGRGRTKKAGSFKMPDEWDSYRERAAEASDFDAISGLIDEALDADAPEEIIDFLEERAQLLTPDNENEDDDEE